METTHRKRLVFGLIALAVVASLVAAFAATSDDEETTTAGSSSTTTTDGETTTTARRSVSDEEAATIVWPDPRGELTYDDPSAAARGASETLLGFRDPLYGELQPGDSRSGEIQVRPVPDGPVTTLLVRQMSDDHWYVIGATSPEIELDEPTAGSAIDHPLRVSGRATASEGQVRVAVHERGDDAPRGEGLVATNGTAELSPFVGEISWDNPGGGWGSVVVTTSNGADGAVWTAIAIPVGFIGGD